MLSLLLALCLLILETHCSFSDGQDDNGEYELIIDPLSWIIQVNSISHNETYNRKKPSPDITIISSDFYLVVWNYYDSLTNSSEIFANLLNTQNARSVITHEFKINRLQGISSDTPSATTLFNSTNQLISKFAVVWESNTLHSNSDNTTILKDGIYGRIYKWSITYQGKYRITRLVAMSSKEFEIYSSDTCHSQNPQIIPIYNTNKWMVVWVSCSNTVLMRIYGNDGKAKSDVINVALSNNHNAWIKHARLVPLFNNYSLITWTVGAMGTQGMIFDDSGNHALTQNFVFDNSSESKLSNDSTSCVVHLHGEYFMVCWQNTNHTQFICCVFRFEMYSYEITRVSERVEVLDDMSRTVSDPQMHNTGNEYYEEIDGLQTLVTLCWSSSRSSIDSGNDAVRSDVYCRLLVVIFDYVPEHNYVEFRIISNDRSINIRNQTSDHNGKRNINDNEMPKLTSFSILRENDDYRANDEFIIVWSMTETATNGEQFFDVYTRLLSVAQSDLYGQRTTDYVHHHGHEKETLSVKRLNILILITVAGIVAIIALLCFCNYLRNKYKANHTPNVRMERIQDLSDDDEDDDDHIPDMPEGDPIRKESIELCETNSNTETR